MGSLYPADVSQDRTERRPQKITGYDWDNEDKYGAKWVPGHELVDKNPVQGDLRETYKKAWTIDPLNPGCETATAIRFSWTVILKLRIEAQLPRTVTGKQLSVS